MNHIAPAMIAAVVAALLAAAPAAALPIDRTITVQPIDVCDSAGANCAGIDTILAATRGATAAIYAQAGIGIAYLPTRTFNDGTYATTTVVQDGATDEARQLLRLPGHQQSANPQVLNLFAVPSLVDFTGISDPAKARTLFGFAFTNGNGIIIGANPRLDTIAHEIGHNLGLNHTTFGAGGGENLLTDGGSRTIPGQVSDIGTTDRLTPAQIAQARSPLFSVRQLPFRATAVPVPLYTSFGTGPVPITVLDTWSPAGYPGLNNVSGDRFQDPGTIVTPPANLPDAALKAVKVRFLPGTSVGFPYFGSAIVPTYEAPDISAFAYDNDHVRTTGDLYCTNVTCTKSEVTVRGRRDTLADGAIEYTWQLDDPAQVIKVLTFACLPGLVTCNITGYNGPAGIGPACLTVVGDPCIESPDPPPPLTAFTAYDEFSAVFLDPTRAAAPIPFSAQFIYADGLTSQGFFDAQGSLTTEQPDALFYQPGTEPVAAADFIIPIPTEFAVELNETAVPEPATIALLALLLPVARRYRARTVPRNGPAAA